MLLSIGSAQIRKNLQIFPTLAEQLRREFSDLSLVRVGGPLPDSLRRPLRELLGDRFLELGFVPEDELPGVYRAASVMVFPSLYEGFGLPLLEAMSAGCAVASSNATSLPEVGGDAVAYFDPHSQEDAVNTVACILRDDTYRRELGERGRQRASWFSWRRHMSGLQHAYRFAATGDHGHLDVLRNTQSDEVSPTLVASP